MSKYGTWMLERLVIKYCDIGGSSRGMRLFLSEALPVFQQQNPQLEVEEVLRRYRHPMLVGLYRNGRSKPICVKNKAPKEIMEQIMWLRNSHGRGMEYHVVRSRHLSRNPSIQGQWTVSTFAADLEAENERRLTRTALQTQF
ncbi:hypothetical protein VaNZ11_015100 [Volvox africanus]|uniref:Large ribosomal subunit protein mL43 n=1 Tax=Volvox africanus TaxID=51714 RepID=A0ABQ5SLA6_9CHLO|nr:hypothetical protein VaNZ11_015100 [Volvox africanus]